MRFDYVKYDERAVLEQGKLKKAFEDLERLVDVTLMQSREKALVFTKLEEAYMWVGKCIRNDQIHRNGSAELQEERNDG